MSSTDDRIALERITYTIFEKNSTTYKLAHIPNRITDISVALPTGSALHMMDRMADFEGSWVIPDPKDIPFTANQPGRMWLYHVTRPLEEGEEYYIKDNYRTKIGPVMQEINSFHRGRATFRRVMSIEAVNGITELHLPIINYDPIFQTIVVGQKSEYLKFELAFRAMLSMLDKLNRPYNYVHIPLNDVLYTNMDFLKPFNLEGELTLDIIKRWRKDAGYYFMVHLLKFIRSAPDSILLTLSEKAFNSLSFALTVGNCAIIYPLRTLLNIRTDDSFYKRIIRHVNTLKIKGSSVLNPALQNVENLSDDDFEQMVDKTTDSPSYRAYTNDRANQKIDTVSPTIILPENVVVPTPEEPVPEQAVDITHGASPQTPRKQFSLTPKSPQVQPTITEPEKPVEVKPEEIVQEETKEEEIPVIAVTPEDQDVPAIDPSPYVKSLVSSKVDGVKKLDTLFSKGTITETEPVLSIIDQNNSTYIERFKDVPERKKQRIHQIANAYKSVTINDKPIEVLLSQNTYPPNPENKIEALEKTVLDKSLLSSSIMDYSKVYMESMFEKDMAAVLSSFGNVGMFLTDIKVENVVNQINQTRDYVATFEDVNGKKHKIKYTLPIVKDDGTFLVNGITNRMHNQLVNLPICKINATQVSLASNFNKYVVERATTVAHSYKSMMTKVLTDIEQKDPSAEISYGQIKIDNRYPYEYTTIGSKYSKINFRGFKFCFSPGDRKALLAPGLTDEELAKKEAKYGVLCGVRTTGEPIFMRLDNLLITEDKNIKPIDFYSLLQGVYASTDLEINFPQMVAERVDLKILNKSIPVIFTLAYRFGLKTMIDYLGVKYDFVKKGERRGFPKDPSRIVIQFKDGYLVFNRYPLTTSLLLAGLARFDLRSYNIKQMDTVDAYHDIITEYGLSSNYLKGVDDFFDFFVDAMTRDVLISMNEPTNVRDLLIRATDMLSTEECIQPSSMRNHRLRGYERLNGILYNEISRGLARYRSRRTDLPFSINPKMVYMKLITDQSVVIEEVINPLHEMKNKTNITYTGGGGRTARSFVLVDRKFPEDGVGILSEATPDSGKVSISAFLSGDPYIKDIRGTFDVDEISKNTIAGGRLLSATALALPGAINDDGKRLAFASIQMSHHVPSEHSETSRVRTGYEQVVAHRVGKNFACCARKSGYVSDVDYAHGTITISYAEKTPAPSGEIDIFSKDISLFKARLTHNLPISTISTNPKTRSLSVGNVVKTKLGQNLIVHAITPLSSIYDYEHRNDLTDEHIAYYSKATTLTAVTLAPIVTTDTDTKDIFKFGDSFSSVSGSYLKQVILPNVHKGETVKEGDVIAYNSGFFEPIMGTKQVSWKHGVMANVVFMEADNTLEDANAISQELSKKLEMNPAHKRTVRITRNTNLHKFVNVGDHVQTVDTLCVIEDDDLSVLNLTSDPDSLEILEDMTRRSLKAKYSGVIAKIDIFYTCDVNDMHPSIQKIAHAVNKRKNALAKVMETTKDCFDYPKAGPLPIGTHIEDVELGRDDIVIQIYITEAIDQGIGDKIVFANNLKSITSSVFDKPMYTESGVPVDAQMGGRSLNNRIVLSPFIQGIPNRVLEKVEQDIVAMYFD